MVDSGELKIHMHTDLGHNADATVKSFKHEINHLWRFQPFNFYVSLWFRPILL